MKDAFGGSFILRIMIIFFVFFISFMVVAINFAKTYRVKNGVISIIQRNYDSTSTEIEDKIVKYLQSVNYGPMGSAEQSEEIKKNKCKVTKNSSYFTYNNGLCVEPVVDGNSYYYRVTSYMVVSTSFFNLGIYIPISGETRTFNNYFD